MIIASHPSRVLFFRRPCVLASTRRASTSSRHATAIVRDVPDSFVDAVVAHAADQADVSLASARLQHERYISHLRECRIRVVRLPPVESHPDCLFVEDTVVAVGDAAVVTRMGHASRRGEAESMKDVLEKLGVPNIYDMRSDDGGGGGEDPVCDGGDVMYTGRHLFVGRSDRTNARGFEFLRNAFANHGMDAGDIISVPPVVAGKEVLHLKSAVTHLDDRTLLAPEGKIGDAVLEAMKAKERGYSAVRLPDILSCNAVVVNGHVLAQDACDISKSLIEKACNERDLGLTFVDTSELAKKDGALTCCSVLLGQTSHS